MPQETEPTTRKGLPIITFLVIVIILALIFALSWLLTRGVEDDNANVPASSNPPAEQLQQNNAAEPTNPNVTGGSSGAGTNTSNDPGVQTPSPAGGVDTNQMPSGSTSPPR